MYAKIENNQIIEIKTEQEVRVAFAKQGVFLPAGAEMEGYQRIIETNAEIRDFQTVESDVVVQDGQAVRVYNYVRNPAAQDAYLKQYRDFRATRFEYKGIIMNLHDGARADLTALYFSVLLNPAIPNETVMAKWQEPGFPTLDLTAGDLRNDGPAIMQHRQNVWTAYDAVKDQIFNSIEDLEAAFDAAMGGLIV